ncbi:MAG: hypothetical protein ABIK86_07295 [candidate division WOR-3 bacterium]
MVRPLDGLVPERHEVSRPVAAGRDRAFDSGGFVQARASRGAGAETRAGRAPSTEGS